MPVDNENRLDVEELVAGLRGELGVRISQLEHEARYDAVASYNTLTSAIEELRSEFETMKATYAYEFNRLIEKLRECSRANDLVDEEGGALDEFLQQFVRC